MPPQAPLSREAQVFRASVPPGLAAAIVRAIQRAALMSHEKVAADHPEGFVVPLQGVTRWRHLLAELRAVADDFGLRLEAREHGSNLVVGGDCRRMPYLLLFVEDVAIYFHNATWRRFPDSDSFRSSLTKGPEVLPLFPEMNDDRPGGFPTDVEEVVTVRYVVNKNDPKRSTISHIDAIVMDSDGETVRALVCEDLALYAGEALARLIAADEAFSDEVLADVPVTSRTEVAVEDTEVLPEPHVRLKRLDGTED